MFVTAVTIPSLTSKPQRSPTISDICHLVMPLADMAMIFCSISDMSFLRLGIIMGEQSPSQSCGTSIEFRCRNYAVSWVLRRCDNRDWGCAHNCHSLNARRVPLRAFPE